MLLPVQNPFVNFPFISQEQIKIKIELHSHYILGCDSTYFQQTEYWI